MGCIRYDKSLTITNMQLIITGIRFCMCHTSNIWSNLLICVGVRKPSDRICCGRVTKREVSAGVITKVHKLGALLCGVPKCITKLTLNMSLQLISITCSTPLPI